MPDANIRIEGRARCSPRPTPAVRPMRIRRARCPPSSRWPAPRVRAAGLVGHAFGTSSSALTLNRCSADVAPLTISRVQVLDAHAALGEAARQIAHDARPVVADQLELTMRRPAGGCGASLRRDRRRAGPATRAPRSAAASASAFSGGTSKCTMPANWPARFAMRLRRPVGAEALRAPATGGRCRGGRDRSR